MFGLSMSSDTASFQRSVDDMHQYSTSSFVVYYCVVIGFCALLRCLVLHRVRDFPLRPRLLEAITCAEQYACWLGHLRVAAVYGAEYALALLAAANVYRWLTQYPGTTANPLSYLMAFVVGECCMSVEEMCTRIGVQVGCSLVSHTLASVIWHHSMLGQHPVVVVAALHCGHPNSQLDTALTAVAQFVCVLALGVLTLRCGSVVVDLGEMIGQFLINVFIIAAGYDAVCRCVAVYLNPLVALSQLVSCLNHEITPILVIYWLIPVSALLLVGGSSCCGSCVRCSCDRCLAEAAAVDDDSSEQSSSAHRLRSETDVDGAGRAGSRDRQHKSASRSRERPHQQQQQQSAETDGKAASAGTQQHAHDGGQRDQEKHQRQRRRQQQTDEQEQERQQRHRRRQQSREREQEQCIDDCIRRARPKSSSRRYEDCCYDDYFTGCELYQQLQQQQQQQRNEDTYGKRPKHRQQQAAPKSSSQRHPDEENYDDDEQPGQQHHQQQQEEQEQQQQQRASSRASSKSRRQRHSDEENYDDDEQSGQQHHHHQQQQQQQKQQEEQEQQRQQPQQRASSRASWKWRKKRHSAEEDKQTGQQQQEQEQEQQQQERNGEKNGNKSQNDRQQQHSGQLGEQNGESTQRNQRQNDNESNRHRAHQLTRRVTIDSERQPMCTYSCCELRSRPDDSTATEDDDDDCDVRSLLSAFTLSGQESSADCVPSDDDGLTADVRHNALDESTTVIPATRLSRYGRHRRPSAAPRQDGTPTDVDRRTDRMFQMNRSSTRETGQESSDWCPPENNISDDGELSEDM